MIKKNFLIVVVAVLLGISYISGLGSVSAATGHQGYAAYRDGVFFGYDWHAGLWDESSSTKVLPIMHAPGPGSILQWDSWENFLDGNNFMGTYKPNEFASSSMRDAFVAMGRNLRTEKISYNLAYQIYYNHSGASNYVHYDEITSMRCDGLVEYIYEWYSYRVYGNDSRWDITKNNVLNREHHGGTLITPKKQVNYLVEI